MNILKKSSQKRTAFFLITFSLLALGWAITDVSVTAQIRERVQQAFQSNLGSGFTYQGYLSNEENPANGNYIFEFLLFDAVTGGSQVGGVHAATLMATDGVFTVLLNNANQFGPDALNGEARFLEIRVWDADENEFVTLTPRQPLTAVPYAHFAQKVQPVGNTITVAKSGGDYTTITAALNAITDASATNPYLIRIAPGIYEEVIYLKSYVDIEGSGENTTIIRGAGGSSFPGSAGTGATLQASGNIVAEVRFLTIESNSTNYATAIWTYSVPPQALKFTHVTANASTSGYMSIGIMNRGFACPKTRYSISDQCNQPSLWYLQCKLSRTANHLCHSFGKRE